MVAERVEYYRLYGGGGLRIVKVFNVAKWQSGKVIFLGR